MSRNWTTLVAEGRRLVKAEGDIKWQLGDLALEAAPMGDDHGHNGNGERLAKFAEAIGYPYATLAVYRDVAAAWAVPTRVGTASWSLHRELMAHPDREDIVGTPGMTVDKARALTGRKATNRPPTITEAIDTLAADPNAMVEHLKQHPEVIAAALTDVPAVQPVPPQDSSYQHIDRSLTEAVVEHLPPMGKHQLNAVTSTARQDPKPATEPTFGQLLEGITNRLNQLEQMVEGWQGPQAMPPEYGGWLGPLTFQTMRQQVMRIEQRVLELYASPNLDEFNEIVATFGRIDA